MTVSEMPRILPSTLDRYQQVHEYTPNDTVLCFLNQKWHPATSQQHPVPHKQTKGFFFYCTSSQYP